MSALSAKWRQFRRQTRRRYYSHLHPRTVYLRQGVFPRIHQRAPATVGAPGEAGWEVHVLCGVKDYTSFCWSLHSLLHVCAEAPPAVVLHEDGTWDDRLCEQVHVAFPGIHLVRRSEADARAAEALRDFPRCRELRLERQVALKYFDYPLWARQDQVGNVDSDVLFFRYPKALAAPEDGGEPCLTFHQDIYTTFSSLMEPLRARGLHPKGRLNSGITRIATSLCRLEEMEDWLDWPEVREAVDAIGSGHLLGDQLLLAITAAAHASRWLPLEEYGVPWDGAKPHVARHYTRMVRPWLLLDGVRQLAPRLLD